MEWFSLWCYSDSYTVLTLTATINNVAINFYKKGITEVLPISRNFTLAIGDTKTTEEIVNGKFSKVYSAPTGEYNITATADNQKLIISFLNNVYVDYVNGRDVNIGEDWKNAVKTIQHVDVVLANGRIYFADGTHVVDSQITIDKTVTIVDNGTKTIITSNGQHCYKVKKFLCKLYLDLVICYYFLIFFLFLLMFFWVLFLCFDFNFLCLNF